MDVLCIRFRPDDEWIGELEVSASAGGFSGVGEAWFSKDNLREFSHAIMAFPLPTDAPPTISGGLGLNEKAPPQELVKLTFEPHNKVGAVRATVHLETANWDGKEHGLHSETTIRLIVTYGDLGRFGPAMLDLIDGRIDEAVLTSTP
jgi:hypothetical protein